MLTKDQFIRLIDIDTDVTYYLPINPTNIDLGRVEYNNLSSLDGPKIKSTIKQEFVVGRLEFLQVPEVYYNLIDILEDFKNVPAYLELSGVEYISFIEDAQEKIEIEIFSVEINFNYRGIKKYNIIVNFKRKVNAYENLLEEDV